MTADDLADDGKPQIMRTSQIQPFNPSKGTYETGDEDDENFSLSPDKLLANIKQLLLSLRWCKEPPMNYKEWFLSIVNDCFFYYLKRKQG